MPKKTKIENEETEAGTELTPTDRVVQYALTTLDAGAYEILQDLLAAGEGSYLQPMPNPEGNFGRAVLHQVYAGSRRKFAKAHKQHDHRTVAAVVKRGFLIRNDEDRTLTLNESFRDSLVSIASAGVLEGFSI